MSKKKTDNPRTHAPNIYDNTQSPNKADRYIEKGAKEKGK